MCFSLRERGTLHINAMRRSRRYNESGWCFTEKTISSVVTPSNMVLDVGIIFDGETNLPDASKVDVSDWPAVVAMCTRGKRDAPIHPDEFQQQIAPGNGRKFTSGADVGIVVNIFNTCYDLCIVNESFFEYSNLGWGDEDCVELAKVMGDCKGLIGLNLSGNTGITMIGIRLLLPHMKGVRLLDIRGVGNGANPQGAIDPQEILRACPRLAAKRLIFRGNGETWTGVHPVVDGP